MDGLWTGLLLVVAAGAMGGSFTVPQKFVRGWAWEKVWLVYSVVGMVLVPWFIVLVSVPHPLAVYGKVPLTTLGLTALFGAGWGVGSVLFGLGVVRVGTGLAFAIVVSLTAALGALVPLIVLHPDQLTSVRSFWLLSGLAVVVVGLVLCARAGALKEAVVRKPESPRGSHNPSQFSRGLLICLLSGIASPMFNFSVAFGGPIQQEAERQGAGGASASSAVLAVGISTGFLVNAGYCLHLLAANRSWRGTAPAARNVFLAVLMGLLWMLGMFAYGLGATHLGSLGPVLGWPLFMTMMVLMGNFWGTVTGEWRRAGPRAFWLLQLGNAAMVLAFVVISIGTRPAS
jgi:L-rhamnose-H+ transport protein